MKQSRVTSEHLRGSFRCVTHLLKHCNVKKNLLNSKKYINKRRRGNHLDAAKDIHCNIRTHSKHISTSCLDTSLPQHLSRCFQCSVSLSSPQIGLASFYQQAISFLCADPKWACQMWDDFSAVSLDLRLSLVTWVVDGRGLQQSGLREGIQRVLQVRHAPLKQNMKPSMAPSL